MKLLFILATLTSLSAMAGTGKSACGISDGNLPFAKSNEKKDDEYKTYEAATSEGVSFYLRSGHGVARLEAWVNGTLISNTFYSTWRGPSETDSLRLEVRNAKGQYVEAQFYGVDAVI